MIMKKKRKIPINKMYFPRFLPFKYSPFQSFLLWRKNSSATFITTEKLLILQWTGRTFGIDFPYNCKMLPILRHRCHPLTDLVMKENTFVMNLRQEPFSAQYILVTRIMHQWIGVIGVILWPLNWYSELGLVNGWSFTALSRGCLILNSKSLN